MDPGVDRCPESLLVRQTAIPGREALQSVAGRFRALQELSLEEIAEHFAEVVRSTPELDKLPVNDAKIARPIAVPVPGIRGEDAGISNKLESGH
jgi:hypothetical protein